MCGLGIILFVVSSIIVIKERIEEKQEQQSIHTKETAKEIYYELKKLNCYPLTDATPIIIETICTKFNVNVSKLKELSDMGYNIVRESEYKKDYSERCGNKYALENVGVIKYTKHILFDIEMKLHKAYKVLHNGNEYLQKKSKISVKIAKKYVQKNLKKKFKKPPLRKGKVVL